MAEGFRSLCDLGLVMDNNIVEQVLHVEAEADRTVADARRQAKELLDSAPRETEALRRKLEGELAAEIESFTAELQRQTCAEKQALEGRARETMSKLSAPASEAVSRAVQLIAERLKGAP